MRKERNVKERGVTGSEGECGAREVGGMERVDEEVKSREGGGGKEEGGRIWKR